MATRPPELSMDAKWEAAIDLTLRRLVYGSLAGGAAGLLLFRACTPRAYFDTLLSSLPSSLPPLPVYITSPSDHQSRRLFISECRRRGESLGEPGLRCRRRARLRVHR